MNEIYDVYTYSEKWHFNMSFYMIHMWPVNLKCFYIESESGRRWDTFSSFDILLFPAKMIYTIYGDGAKTESTVYK